MPRKVQLRISETDSWTKSQKGKWLSAQDFDQVISREAVKVYKPNGEPLLLLIPSALPLELCRHVRPIWRKAAMKNGEWRKDIKGGVAGYWECRMTQFTRANLDKWVKLLPFIRSVNRVFSKGMPSRYIPQRQAALRSNPDLVIGGTAFTTVTANLWNDKYSGRTYVHTDRNDYEPGFGVITVMRTRKYKGGELIFPKYRVAVDLHTTDVLLCDVHEFHGNNAITDGEIGWERLSTISYFREKILDCPK